MHISPKHRFFPAALLALSACGPAAGGLEDTTASSSVELPLTVAASPFVTRQGTQLYVNGTPTTFVGVNRYDLAGGPLAPSCQHAWDAASFTAFQDDFIKQAAAQGVTLVRLWAFQNFAGPSGTDFSAFDQVVASAKKYNVKLLPVIENNWQDCTQPSGVTKDDAFFTNGYKAPYGNYRLSLPDYTTALVNHFKDEPAIAMWQVINEGKWYQNPNVLTGFLGDMASRIKAIDSNHLVSGGAAIQCWQGNPGADFQNFGTPSAIDVLDAHDYEYDTQAWPGCMQAAATAAANLGKPLIIGEAGISTDKFSTADRANYFAAKMQSAADHKAQAYLIWEMNTVANYHDGFDFFPGDATALIVKQASQQWYGTRAPVCSVSGRMALPVAAGNGAYTAVVDFAVQNLTPTHITAPWTLSVQAPELTGLELALNWTVTNFSAGSITGQTKGSNNTLRANSKNTVHVGGTMLLNAKTVTVKKVTINGLPCSVQ